MSWSYCAISGEQLHEPVVSKKSGHVFEKRIIDKYITSTGQCPITGQALTVDDLVSVNLTNSTKPRSATLNSVPGILKSFQSEWDAQMLETFTLKQHLETVRQELSHALYQHDAACRVIARLIQERDEARREVSELQERLRNSAASMEVEEEETAPQVLPENVIKSINEATQSLTATRKDRKKDTEFNSKFPTQQQIASYQEKKKVPVLDQNAQGINTMAFCRNTKLAVIGGSDGSVVIVNLNTVSPVATLKVESPLVSLSIITPYNSTSETNLRFIALSSHSATVYEYITSSAVAPTSLYKYESSSELTAVSPHPNGSVFVVGARNGTLTYHDLTSKSLLLTVKDLQGTAQVNSVQIHPDGNLLAVGCKDGSVKLWNIVSNELLTSLEDGLQEPIDLLSFSESGITLAIGSRVGKTVKIFDLRKAACSKTLSGLELTSLEFELSGTMLAIGTEDGKVNVLESKKWNQVATFKNHQTSVTAVKFDTFSQRFISASEDKTISVLEI